MCWIEALILGIVQGLTEFLPVSSSGHLEIGKAILQVEAKENLSFSIVVHGATVLSILVVFWKDLKILLVRSFRLEYNEENSYVLKLLLSMVPVGIVGVLFKEQVESFFTGNLVLVGSMLLITATLLAITHFLPEKNGRPVPGTDPERASSGRKISFLDAIVIGIAQALAVMPGISRSGATIATALFLGNKREEAARFSFLMVILPILAANFLDLLDMASGSSATQQAAKGAVREAIQSGAGVTIGWIPLLVGFVAAFVSGLIACRWMLSIVHQGKLLYFGIYCLLVGLIAIFAGLF